ncbi:hypothetical protein PN36_25305 [Candidatus Thiomargarita nelsonii]|uniref:Uncharacterized protein n=1 Tax=Candidatus Thiomargarita nelsonii TaxID=1003181 RepID=A0A0A6PB13_9GAMM|nr:hypothetical protein PN36_25305 [Candidatus Thiomargarita nelsonii]
MFIIAKRDLKQKILFLKEIGFLDCRPFKITVQNKFWTPELGVQDLSWAVFVIFATNPIVSATNTTIKRVDRIYLTD